MPIFSRVSGTWRTITSPRVRVSGTWRDVTGAWVRVSGTWRQVYAAWAGSLSSIPLVTSDFRTRQSDATAAILLQTNGEIVQIIGPLTFVVGRWDGGNAYTLENSQVRFTVTAGTVNQNNATTWVNPRTAGRIVQVVQIGVGSNLVSVTAELRNSNNITTVVSRSFQLQATVENF